MKNISEYNSSPSNFLSFSLLGKTKVKKKRMYLCVASWLSTALFWKSLGQIVRFSIKSGDQTDETESPNLVNKTGLSQKVEYQSFL